MPHLLVPSDATHPTLDVMRTTVTESVYTLRTGFWPLALLRPLPAPQPRPDRPAVVMVHGFMGHPEALRPLARRLLKGGWPAVVRPGYPSTRVRLEDIVERIASVVEPLAAEGPVDLIGHSLGAVAARAYLKEFGGAPFVRRFLSLGGPHHGTSLYRFVPPWLRPALHPRGTWVKKLNETPEPVPTIVIRAAYDHQVFPPRRAVIPGAREIVLHGFGHNGLLWARSAHEAVVRALLAPDEVAAEGMATEEAPREVGQDRPVTAEEVPPSR